MEEPLKRRGIFEFLFPSAPQRFLEVRLTGQSISEILPSVLSDDVSEVQKRCTSCMVSSCIFHIYYPFQKDECGSEGRNPAMHLKGKKNYR